MKSFIALFILGLFVAISSGVKLDPKAVKLEKKVRDGVISFSQSSYDQYVATTPRPYHLILLFTASESRYGCDVCLRTFPEFMVLAESFSAMEKAQKQSDDGLPVYFGIVEHSSCSGAYSYHSFTSAPHIVYMEPNDEVIHSPPSKIDIPEKFKYNVYSSGHTAEDIVGFIKSRTGVSIVIQRSMLGLYLLLGAVLLLGLCMLYLALAHMDFFLKKLRNRRLWMLVSIMLYSTSISGMVFCIIRSPPPFSQDRSGKIMWFHPQGRQQFVMEGFLVGGYNVGAALCVILLTQFAANMQKPSHRYLAIAILVMGFLYCYRLVVQAYAFKNPWFKSHSWLA